MVKRSHKKNIGVTKNATTSKFVWSIKSSIVFWIILIVLSLAFITFTYKTPKIGIFKDPVTGSYGIK